MLPARIRDISLSGMRVEGPVALGAGEATAMDLHLPDERVVLKALAEVVWSRPSTDDKQPHSTFRPAFCGLGRRCPVPPEKIS